MGNKLNSLRGREEEELEEGGNVRTRSISVGGGGSSGSSLRAMSSAMSAPSASRYGRSSIHEQFLIIINACMFAHDVSL